METAKIERITFSAALRTYWTNFASRVTVFIGENGAGKSRLLAHIAKQANRAGYPVCLIANTPFDRFGSIRGKGVSKSRASYGSSLPEHNIKQAIRIALDTDALRLRRLPAVFLHCGYEPELGVEIVPGQRVYRPYEVDDAIPRGVWRDIGPLASAISSGRFPEEKIVWIDFGEDDFVRSEKSLFPQIIRYQKYLSKLGVIKDIHFFLRKKDGVINMRDASSGELSLISSMAFLAVSVRHDSLVIVDEPENSLHPRWQQQYIDLSLQFCGYEGARLMIATHSPIIVSAIADEESVDGNRIVVIKNGDSDVLRVKNDGRVSIGIDGLLTEAFNTITPQSHHLSVIITDLLEGLEGHRNTRDEVFREIDRLIEASGNEEQKEALRAARLLADRVANNA